MYLSVRYIVLAQNSEQSRKTVLSFSKYSSKKVTTLQNFTYGDTPENSSLKDLTEEILNQPNTFDVSYYELSGKFDIRELVLRTYFTYLELLNILTHIAPYYSEYKINFTLPKSHICKFPRFNKSTSGTV